MNWRRSKRVWSGRGAASHYLNTPAVSCFFVDESVDSAHTRIAPQERGELIQGDVNCVCQVHCPGTLYRVVVWRSVRADEVAYGSSYLR